MTQKQGFSLILKNFAIDFCWKCPFIKIYVVIYLTVKIPYLRKYLLFSQNLKGFQPISLQNSLITNSSCLNDWITLFLHVDRQNRKKNSTKSFIRCGQACPRLFKIAGCPQRLLKYLHFH